MKRLVLVLLISLSGLRPAIAQTPDEWVAQGTRVHGGFGSLIAVGIRIGLEGLRDLGASAREVDVTYRDGVGTPCPCIVDGIQVATGASAGQKSLRVAAEPAPAGDFALIEMRHRGSGAVVRYRVPDSARTMMLGLNRLASPLERYAAVMQTPAADIFIRLP
jgi:formylmethanofuran dehydrogenase subunit E